MKKAISIAAFVLLGVSASFAETVTGTLVDANCVNRQSDQKTPPASESNMAKVCSAKQSTTMFALETQDGMVLRLDNAGNAQAREQVRSTKGGMKPPAMATINGTVEGKTIRVQSIEIH